MMPQRGWRNPSIQLVDQALPAAGSGRRPVGMQIHIDRMVGQA